MHHATAYPHVMITSAISEQQEFEGAPQVRVATDYEPLQGELTRPVQTVFDASDPIARERTLAASVLRQAALDLRRFRESKNALGREMYSDARSWFISNDTEWPYSFANVCGLLGLETENVRDEVFADARSSWISHSRRVALAMTTRLIDSFATLLF